MDLFEAGANILQSRKDKGMRTFWGCGVNSGRATGWRKHRENGVLGPTLEQDARATLVREGSTTRGQVGLYGLTCVDEIIWQGDFDLMTLKKGAARHTGSQ